MSESTKDVVINRCYGGFSLSPKAALLCFERGMQELGTPIDEYFTPYPRSPYRREEALREWRAYLANANPSLFLTVFSTDERMVIDTRPRDRANPILAQVCKELGSEASGYLADVSVVSIPADVEYTIEEYDGIEHIAEVHRTWP